MPTHLHAIVFDRDGKVIAVAQKEFPQIYPKPGWVEHDPFEIWSSQNSTAAEALSRANLSTDEIAAALNVSRKTAANYHYAIKAKLGASSDIELLYLGLRHGLIEPVLPASGGDK